MPSRSDFHRYWGKARQDAEAGSAPCHLLPYHCLDVAAVGRQLLGNDPVLTRRLAKALDMEPDTFQGFFVFALALHDLGKFARSFQGLARIEGCDLVPDTGKTYTRKHDLLGAALWQEDLLGHFAEPRCAGGTMDMDTEDALDLWLGCFFGHHGKPALAGGTPLEADFEEADRAAALNFTQAAEELLSPRWPHEHLRDAQWCEQQLAPVTWQLAGLAILCDWLGSNADFFPYRAEPISLTEYWEANALPGAQKALRSAGLLNRPITTNFPGFTQSFGFAPTPLQDWAENVPLAAGPQLFLLEDITGSGKTESALTLAHRLLAEGHGSGLYFGLPTMATSNAMYQRLGTHYRQLYSEESHPSLVLAHGARHLSETFTASVVPEPNADQPYSRDDQTAGAECRAWLADSRKKALLAEVGVGTIDQALLGVLPRKHQALRLLGLADKVLVVDEVHAYDLYTDTLLHTLLEEHARQGGSAILLSATIPHHQRQELADAWQKGRACESVTLGGEGFPLATQIHDQGRREEALAARPASRKDLPVRLVHDSDEALERVLTAAREGRCACWIRNTVDDAITAYRSVCERLDDPEQALVFHARFTMADRQRIEEEALTRFGKDSTSETRWGRILIATQVVEQSLDLDFDVLVSDLAPIELLIQRAGRLHRHPRDASGNLLRGEGTDDKRPDPELQVLSPEWSDEPGPHWVRHLLPGTNAVYPDPALLWRTCKILREEGGIQLPERARVLLEGVYGEEAALPDGLAEAHFDNWAGERVAQSNARFNALDLARGYSRNANGWDDDQEIGTRLSNERTIPVVLVRAEGGRLRPRHEDHDHPWAMSTLNLRESLANRLPGLPEGFQQEAEALRQAHPQLRYSRFWLPEAETNSQAIYGPELGGVIPRKNAQGGAP
jgi:CRISPR-associated endonuclease/helicase Cas3